MSVANDGGQAFPRAGFGFAYTDGGAEAQSLCDGMSLRDYFAAQFAASLSFDIVDRIAARNLPSIDELSDDKESVDEFVVPPVEIARRIAVAAYKCADAMLVERKRAR